MSEERGPTGGRKATKMETYDDLPPAALRDVARVAAIGREKYGANNYRRGFAWSASFSAAQRHLWAFWGGEDLDPESKLPHVAHAAWHCLALASFMADHPALDDRWRTAEQKEAK